MASSWSRVAAAWLASAASLACTVITATSPLITGTPPVETGCHRILRPAPARRVIRRDVLAELTVELLEERVIAHVREVSGKAVATFHQVEVKPVKIKQLSCSLE
jgi:hypothetical protein